MGGQRPHPGGTAFLVAIDVVNGSLNVVVILSCWMLIKLFFRAVGGVRNPRPDEEAIVETGFF